MISKLSNVFSEFGVGNGILYLIHRGLSLISANSGIVNYNLVAQPVPDQPIVSARACRNIELRNLDESATELAAIPIPTSVVSARFAQGAECYGIFRDGKFIAYGWLDFSGYAEDEIRVDFKLPDDRSAFDFDVYVFPEFRLGRSFVCLWEALNSVMRDRNVRYTYSRISRFNTQSMRSHQQLGANSVGWLIGVRLFGLQFMFSSCSPYCRLSFRRRGRVSLQLPSVDQSSA